MTSILGPRKLHLERIWQLTNRRQQMTSGAVSTILERHKCTVKNQADILHFAIKFFTYLAPAFSKRFCINLFSHDCRDNPGGAQRQWASSTPPPSRCGGAVGGEGVPHLAAAESELSQEVRATQTSHQVNGPRETLQVKGAWVWWEKQTVLCFP